MGTYRDNLRLSTNPEPLSCAHITRWLKNQATLFPDKENVASYIKKQFLIRNV
nr:hypothetical protein [Lacticaseibacillus paracasei]